MHRHAAPVLGLAVLAALTGGSRVTAAEATLQLKLKAAIVSKLPQFVQWPPGAFGERRTMDICVASPDPFGPDLRELVEGESLDGRRLVVRNVEQEADVEGCSLLYVPEGTLAARRPLLRKAVGLPILTISDDQRILDEGGIVRLRLVEGRIRFDINAEAARRVGLRISSQLLQLAMTVRGGES